MAGGTYFVELDGGQLQASETADTLASYKLSFDTACKLDKFAPKVNSKSAILVDWNTGNVLYAKGAEETRPIASISKLLSAMVILDKGTDLALTEVITKEDARRSSRSRLPVGTKLTLRDFLNASLLVSDNRATRVLARATCGSIDAFAIEMNKKAKELGLTHSLFFEPTGLDSRNVSTAHEVAMILYHASKYKLITSITSSKSSKIRLLNRKNRFMTLTNTNRLTLSKMKVLAGKTGYINEAQHCLATIVQNSKGEKLSLVVLGVPGDKLRFREARKLAEWGFK